jgi:hypothetical protein
MFLGQRHECGHIGRIDAPGLPAPRIAREELKRARADLDGRTPHGQKTLGRGKVTPDIQHHTPIFLN